MPKRLQHVCRSIYAPVFVQKRRTGLLLSAKEDMKQPIYIITLPLYAKAVPQRHSQPKCSTNPTLSHALYELYDHTSSWYWFELRICLTISSPRAGGTPLCVAMMSPSSAVT